MKTRPARRTVGLMICALLLGAANAQAGFTLLHKFAGGADEGSWPFTSELTLSGSTLYGMTFTGGDSDGGTVFKMNTDGTGYSLLHKFDGGFQAGPRGSLTLSSATLYGMTVAGGGNNLGTVFKVNTDGTGFSLLHQFAGGGGDGAFGLGSLTLSGSTLYGMTAGGGGNNLGTVFKMNTDGTGFNLLHQFAGGADDGNGPWGSLTLSDSTLYGMTFTGGDSDGGTVFKMNADGSGFSLLHEFAGGASDGSNPKGNLTLFGSTLYGMTGGGGDNDLGTVFKMNTDGSDYSLLHKFAGGGEDGNGPWGSLTLSDSTLYGMTCYGGDNDRGTLFEVNTDGSNFSLLHKFVGGGDDGANPFGSLALDGSTLYGMTGGGGDNDLGTVFAFVPEPSSLALAVTGLLALTMRRRRVARWGRLSSAVRNRYHQRRAGTRPTYPNSTSALRLLP